MTDLYEDTAEYEADNAPIEPPFYSVAIYLCDRAFGGPEEGGWWYGTTERVDTLLPNIDAEFCLPKFFVEKAAAREWAAIVNQKLAEGPNNGRYEISSVLSEGMYVAEVHDGYPVPYTPATRPHYE